MARIGYCCKTVVPDVKHGIRNISEMNFRSTTAKWCREHPKEAEQRLWEITEHNCRALLLMVEYVGGLDEHRRMVRVGSDIWPLATHPQVEFFWDKNDARDMAGKMLEQVGDYCRSHNIRLSQHPGQFVCFSSDRDEVVENSITEFEYHAEIARRMGYGASWHDHGYKINIHVSGHKGIDGFRQVLKRLSPEARNLITVENDENVYGLDDVLELADELPIVLDVHHHWVATGEYIQTDDDRVRRVIESWRGVRPIIHYSLSREDILVGHNPDTLPDRNALMHSGINRQKLRSHSDMYWNRAANRWAASFLEEFDIMCEAKCKNLASAAFTVELNL